MTVAARITYETLPGLLRDFRTASDKSCGGGLGTRLTCAWVCMVMCACVCMVMCACVVMCACANNTISNGTLPGECKGIIQQSGTVNWTKKLAGEREGGMREG